MTVNLTPAQYRAFSSGKALAAHLKARGITKPEDACQAVTCDETGDLVCVSFMGG